jgi:hypothetical protein
MSAARISAWFSTIPFRTISIAPSSPACGWALASVTLPWVAHLVWAMPVQTSPPDWPSSRPASPSASPSIARLPTALTFSIVSPEMIAIPAES